MAPFALQVFGGSFQSLGQVAGIAGTLVLALMILALGSIAYKQLRGGGIEWPDEKRDGDEISRGDTDDEWDYY